MTRSSIAGAALVWLATAACATGAPGAPAPAPPPAAPPPPPAPPPPIGDPPDIQVCIVENGAVLGVTARYNLRTGDTTVSGRPFSEVYPATGGYAAGAMWYINNEAITVNGRRYVKYGLPRVLGIREVARGGEYRGVTMFQEAGGETSGPVLYAPVRSGCEFQPYVSDLKPGGVRGEQPRRADG